MLVVSGAAASLLSFVQFVIASTGALVVGLAFDGTVRPTATTIAVSALLAAAAFAWVLPRAPVGREVAG